MERMNLVGFEHIKGDSRKTGNPYDGFLVYLEGEPRADSKCIGNITDNTYIDATLFKSALDGRKADESLIGSKITLLYNKSGFLIKVIIEDE